MIQSIIKDAESHMAKSIEAFKEELGTMRTGRANPSLLEGITISYYGNETPLSQIGSVNVGDSQTLLVTPWEKNLLSDIEKAIREAGLGLNPVTSGTSVRVPLPALTEERRKELVKVAKAEAENSRVAIRNIRRNANNESKNLLKKKEVTEDDDNRLQESIQKLTDKYIAQVDATLAEKEKELMEV